MFNTATQSFGVIVNSAGRLSLPPKRAGSGGDRPTRRHGNLAVSAVDLDVQSQTSAAVAEIVRRHSHLEVVVHNAGHIPSPTASGPEFYHRVGVADLLSPNAAL